MDVGHPAGTIKKWILDVDSPESQTVLESHRGGFPHQQLELHVFCFSHEKLPAVKLCSREEDRGGEATI